MHVTTCDVMAGLSAPSVEVPTTAEVYAAHGRIVWRVLRRLGVPESEIEDAAQEVFVVVHRKLADFAGRSSLRTWVCGIAVRCALEHRRRHARREEPTDDIDLAATDASPIESLEQREARAMLERILASLDDAKRAVFVLYELEGLSMNEVAEVVGCPLQTAYSRLHAGRAHVDAAVARMSARAKSEGGR